MIRGKVTARKAGLSLMLVLALLFVFINPALAATEIKAPSGAAAYGFSIDLMVNESEPYAGIQFELTLSDESALEFMSFTQGNSINGASEYPLIYSHGVHSFGFWKGSNAFQGSMTVGTLNFTYTGSVPQTITITRMMVVRIDGNNPVGENKDASALPVINVSRETAAVGTDETGGTSGTGGTGGQGATSGSGGGGASGTGSGNPIIVIEDEETPLAALDEKKSKYFDDVPEEAWPWAVNEIDYLYEAGVVKGTAPSIYSPAANITRGDFMLMLVRAFDLKAEISGNFPDVPQGSYYYDAIAIAKTLEIAKGDGIIFYPQSFITRQDMMALIDRTLRAIGKSLPPAPQSVLSPFSDNAKVSDYARDSVAALVQSEIIKGTGSGINPLGNTTRAETAVVVHRILTMD
ncbi:MAG: S-layer homology domain-containing protein [Syntrophomonadaceae bacterium]|nr:S-layer homology domain-containing protein [Syntrophomonadaceae bacterium]